MYPIKQFRENFIDYKTVTVRLLPTEIQARRLRVMCNQFETITRDVFSEIQDQGFVPDYNVSHRKYRDIYNCNSELVNNVVSTANRASYLTDKLEFKALSFITNGPLTQPVKSCKTKFKRVAKNPSSIIIPGFRTDEILTDCDKIPLYHLATISFDGVDFHCHLDIKPEPIKSHPEYRKNEYRIKKFSPPDVWYGLDGNILTKEQVCFDPKPYFTYEQELTEGQKYIGHSSVQSRVWNTMNYSGSSPTAHLAKRVCGLKIIKKTILDRFSYMEEARIDERKRLAKVSFSGLKSHLNASTGASSCELFSIKKFLIP